MYKLEKGRKVILWGLGDICRRYIHILDEVYEIVAVCDSDKNKWNTEFYGHKCISSEDILAYDDVIVVIMVEKETYRAQIAMWLKSRGIDYCVVSEILESADSLYQDMMIAKYEHELMEVEPGTVIKLSKYINASINVAVCNLGCSYCYISDYININSKNAINKKPRFVRVALRQKRLGGAALISLCGDGETTLCDDLPEICLELLREGHCLHICSNGVSTERIERILSVCHHYSANIIFKLSFHYEQLKKKGLLDRFAHNVKIIEASPASYTLELMPHDELVEQIEDIVKYSYEAFGALPHLTIGRDESKQYNIMTSYSEDVYRKIWSVFDSQMFDFKMEKYNEKTCECNAGEVSFSVELCTGKIMKCIKEDVVGNIYVDIGKNIGYERVGGDCKLPYCFNNHIYYLLGVVPEKCEIRYVDIRDREKRDGMHWIKKGMRDNLSQCINIDL